MNTDTIIVILSSSMGLYSLAMWWMLGYTRHAKRAVLAAFEEANRDTDALVKRHEHLTNRTLVLEKQASLGTLARHGDRLKHLEDTIAPWGLKPRMDQWLGMRDRVLALEQQLDRKPEQVSVGGSA